MKCSFRQACVNLNCQYFGSGFNTSLESTYGELPQSACLIHGICVPQVPLVVKDISKEVVVVPSPSLPPSWPPSLPVLSSYDFGCLDFELMTDVRELGQWCGSGGRNSDPVACNNAYATTFPNDNFAPGYFRTPHEYRSPNVRVQRQRCVHNNLEGAAGRCTMENEKHQCEVPTSVNTVALAIPPWLNAPR
eukprot:5763163-Pleurochrysis_carterae.AAC.1